MSKPLKIKKVSASNPINETAIKILRTRMKEFYSHWPDPQKSPTYEQLHNLRISSKRLRYSAEQVRELFPDRLALLIDLLKRLQDLLGQIQDCVTQGKVIENELARFKRSSAKNPAVSVLEKLLANYEERKSMFFLQFRQIWMGMAQAEFRAGLKALVSTTWPRQSNPEYFESARFENEEPIAFQSGSVSE